MKIKQHTVAGLAFALIIFPNQTLAGWKTALAGGCDAHYTSNIIVMGEVLYVSSLDGAVYAFDVHKGEQLWRFQTGEGLTSGPVIIRASEDTLESMLGAAAALTHKLGAPKREVVTTPVVKNGTVYFGSKDWHFYALDASTGKLKWSFDAGREIVNDCIVRDDSVYFNAELFVYALNAEDGQTSWSFEGEGSPSWSFERPVLENEGLYVVEAIYRKPTGDLGWGTITTHIYSLDPTSGKERSVFNYDRGIASRPAVSGGLVYFYSFPFLYAVDVSSGKVKWKFENKEATGIPSPVLLGDKVVYSASDGYGLHAVDRQTGELRWTLKSDDLSVTNMHSAGKLYVARKSSVLALNPDTGAVVWSTRVGRNQWIQAIVGGVVYVSNNDNLIALDARTGKKRWSFNTGTELCSPPVEVDGQLCFSTLTELFWGGQPKQGHLYCIDTKTGKL